MADLEAAAEAALVKVTQLAELGQEAEDALQSLEERLTTIREQVESDAQALAGDVSDFLERLEDEKKRLHDRGEEVAGALSETQASVATTNEDVQQGLQEARAEVAALAGPVQAAPGQIDEMVQELETAAQSFRDQAAAIEAQLEQAFAEAREFVGVDVVDDLRAMREAVEERAQAVQETIGREYETALQAKYDHWLATLNEVEGLVHDAFERARDHVTQVVEYALEEAPRRHQVALDELPPLVATLEGAAEALQGAVAEIEAEVQQGHEATAEEVRDTGSAAQAMTTALEGLKALLARFTFVQM